MSRTSTKPTHIPLPWRRYPAYYLATFAAFAWLSYRSVGFGGATFDLPRVGMLVLFCALISFAPFALIETALASFRGALRKFRAGRAFQELMRSHEYPLGRGALEGGLKGQRSDVAEEIRRLHGEYVSWHSHHSLGYRKKGLTLEEVAKVERVIRMEEWMANLIGCAMLVGILATVGICAALWLIVPAFRQLVSGTTVIIVLLLLILWRLGDR